jgi:hypothetical protein
LLDPATLRRTVSLGKNAELILTGTRSYRSPMALDDPRADSFDTGDTEFVT